MQITFTHVFIYEQFPELFVACFHDLHLCIKCYFLLYHNALRFSRRFQELRTFLTVLHDFLWISSIVWLLKQEKSLCVCLHIDSSQIIRVRCSVSDHDPARLSGWGSHRHSPSWCRSHEPLFWVWLVNHRASSGFQGDAAARLGETSSSAVFCHLALREVYSSPPQRSQALLRASS